MSNQQELPDNAAERGPQPAGAQEAVAFEQLKAELEEADRERRQFRELAQRAQADLVNYRKRVEEERGEMQRAATTRVVTKLLPVLDNLHRALADIPSEARETPWVEGVRLIQRSILVFLESEGVVPIEAEGKPFDPWEHEAIMVLPSAEQAPGTVVSVIRPGFKLQGKVLRAAQVVVSQESTPKVHEPSESAGAHIPKKSEEEQWQKSSE